MQRIDDRVLARTLPGLMAVLLASGTTGTPAVDANVGSPEYSFDDTVSERPESSTGDSEEGTSVGTPGELPLPGGANDLDATATPIIDPLEQEVVSRELDLWRLSRRLDVPFRIVRDGVFGFELLSARRYPEGREIYERLNEEKPESAVGPFGLMFLEYALMSENLDFSEEAAYVEAQAQVMERTRRALRDEQAPAWNLFLRGTALGMNSHYMYRKDKLFAAVRDGWNAISDMEKALEIEPRFVDPHLGLGLYNYWRSVLTIRYKQLPGFSDRREEGIAQMKLARDEGIFSRALGRMSLTFSYYEERKYKQALKESLSVCELYPDNIINLQMLGRIYNRMRKYEEAEEAYLRVTIIDPSNVQVYHYLGTLQLYRKKDLKAARESFSRVVAGKPGTYYGEINRVRLGDVCWMMGDEEEAERHWETALELAPKLRAAQFRANGWRPTKPGERKKSTTRRRVTGPYPIPVQPPPPRPTRSPSRP